MNTASARVLASLPEEDAALLAHVEDDYQSMKSRRQCSRRDFMDGYLAAARRFSLPQRRRTTRAERTTAARVLEAIS